MYDTTEEGRLVSGVMHTTLTSIEFEDTNSSTFSTCDAVQLGIK